MKPTLALVITLVAATASADPQPDSPTAKGAFAEINLAPYIFHGYSGFVGYHYGHWQVGGGVYSFKLPDFIRDSGFNNADGLTIHSKLGLGLFGRYFLKDNGTGAYGAVQLGWERFGATSDAMPGAGENLMYETYINPYVGYLWKPTGHGFFINPNAGVAFSTTTSGSFTLAGQTYGFKGYVPLVFFQVGYELD